MTWVFLYRVAKFTFSLLVLQVLERLKCCFIQWLMHDRKKKEGLLEPFT